ncbi:hypothetical protein ACLI1C_15340 [Devosia sp. XGJD_8]|uniref:hypothetical protein n=1 Tax=Devosia sp. XGJD_8 TaxID=3391187 RepID=UPI003984F29D
MSNDTADMGVIESVVSLWDFASLVDEAAVEFSRDALIDAVQRGFSLRTASPATWAEFLSHPLWKEHPRRRPKMDEQEAAPKFALQIYFGRANRATKRTSDYWRALQQLEYEGRSNSKIVEDMVKGEATIRAICGRRAEQLRRAGPNATKTSPGKPARTITTPRSSNPPQQSTPPKDASARRAETVDGKATQLNFLEGLPNLKVGETYAIITKVLAGGGCSFEVKALKVKPKKSG